MTNLFPTSKITYQAASAEAASKLRRRLQTRGIPTGRRGCEVYFFGCIHERMTKSDYFRFLQSLEAQK
jgi:hypothetical protein